MNKVVIVSPIRTAVGKFGRETLKDISSGKFGSVVLKDALNPGGLTVDNLNLIEASKACAGQIIEGNREMGLDADRVNLNGGVIAPRHPIGASSTRIFVTLLHELRRRSGKYGPATLCTGRGESAAILVKR